MLDYNLSEDSDNASPELGSTKKTRKHHTTTPQQQKLMKRGFYNVQDEDEITFKSSEETGRSIDLHQSIEEAWRIARDEKKNETRLRLSK